MINNAMILLVTRYVTKWLETSIILTFVINGKFYFFAYFENLSPSVSTRPLIQIEMHQSVCTVSTLL